MPPTTLARSVLEKIRAADTAMGAALQRTGHPETCECSVCWPIRQARQRLVLALEEAKSL